MSAVNRYVDRVLDCVFAPGSNLARLETDLRARFDQGMANGESEAEVLQRLGTPEEVAEAFMADIAFDYAGFWERTWAFLADMAIYLLITLPFFTIIVEFLGPGNDSGSSFRTIAVAGTLGCLALAVCGVLIFYFPILESRFGKTLGKHLMSIEVRSEKGARIGLGAAFLRRLSMYFDFLPLDALFIPFTQKNQRAFDIVAKTIVVRSPDRGPDDGHPLICLALFVAACIAWAAAIYFVISRS